MKTLKLEAILTYDDKIMHSGNKDLEAKKWFFNLLKSEDLILHSNEIGDAIGTLRIKKVVK